MKKYIDLGDVVNSNCSNVLDIIQKKGPLSRKEITELTGLSWGGMTKIVNRLLESGYITEKKTAKAPSSGRKPGIICVNTDTNFIVGLDINKTGLNAQVMNLSGEILSSFSSEVRAKNKNSFIEEITDFVKTIFSQFPDKSIISMGVAMQGTVNCKDGISVRFPSVSDWENVPIKDILEKEFDVSVFIEHDPDCLLYSHLNYDTNENTVLLRIDKSIGMAVAVNNKIIKGESVFEIAHTCVIPDGAKCSCGLKGCMEAYTRPCIKDGNPDRHALSKLIVPLSIVVQNMSLIFNAKRIILTGKLMENHEIFEDKLFEILRKSKCRARIEFSNTADYVVRGASLIAINKSINSMII